MSSKSSTSESRRGAPVLVGLIHKPHGLAGEVAVEPLSDVAGRFDAGSELELAVAGVPRRGVRIRSSRSHGRGLLVAFEGVEDRAGAEELRGGRLEVAREAVPPAAAGEYYHFELLGCRCVDARGTELGVVDDVVEDGGGEILCVRDESGELLVPFVAAFLTRVDVAGGVIELDLPAGLIETCRSRS
ncbi:MAG: ribosome maturation factor RimM [Acidobacteriota bacterium]|nr:ribosome maturation factor RimM [Acidobacteriota bacterium]